MRRIAHIDMDAFYASVELLRRPELRDLPVAIGGRGDPTRRGVVTTANYVARRYGIRSAMPLRQAYQLCPQCVFLPVDFDEYRKYSRLFKAAIVAIAPDIEDRGIDEVYADLSSQPGDSAAIGHAITGAGENWYHGQGFGTASPTPYPDSAPHRPATTVSPATEARSRALATRMATRFRAVFTPANGAGSRFAGVVPRTGNPRMMRFYGYYRTNADARVLIECGAAGADDAFLRRVDLIGGAVSAGIVDDLRARGLLAG